MEKMIFMQIPLTTTKVVPKEIRAVVVSQSLNDTLQCVYDSGWPPVCSVIQNVLKRALLVVIEHAHCKPGGKLYFVKAPITD